MKKFIFVIIPSVIVLAILSKFIYNILIQKEEFAYHSTIPKTITIESDDFKNDNLIPIECTGDSADLSPNLKWSNLPPKTKSLAIIAVDYDAPAPYFRLMTIDHWVVFNINPKVDEVKKGLKMGEIENSFSFGKNISGHDDYVGPKPPFGVHNYYFRVYALNVAKLELTQPSKEELMKAMKGKIIAYGEIIGKYGK